ncbi:VCBS repeat-containing protein [Streptomyces sp. 35G-GA-8]|uniref:FG-GAP repeat domain-containing protein n=1 Tax=Streptomyces sp. 35G-GA-8 TaxID=2939434 RepID=UPI00201F23D7|nr:VCBS repeat-containing protein [Streptomyces sp. 35G-GA-8]MCL7381242.1 VCBS repeat-containing protein [Streptomyces sp. 35G-GA-8]
MRRERGCGFRGRGFRTAACAAVCAAVCTALLLTGCTAFSGPDGGGGQDRGKGTAADKNGDTAPLSGRSGAPRRPVPRGKGSRVPDDFNGDGHPDLVLNDLVKAPGDTYGDDAGIGIVYGTATARGVDPAVRQILSPREHGARVDGVLPSAFDAEAACDLDGDGFGDLIVTTDPPYDGIGAPPVPLQILFGGPDGLGGGGDGKTDKTDKAGRGGDRGRAVVLRIPAKARAGDEWPDHPVCGDFDGDGEMDLAVTASAGQVSYLRGPFSRTGAPRAASAPIPGGGPVLEAPTPKADVNGDGYDDLVHLTRARAPGHAAKGELLLGGPEGPGRAGGAYRFKGARFPTPPRLPSGSGRAVTELVASADFTGDGRQDLVTRTHRGERTDLIALYPSGADRPVITFSTSIFLG